MKAFVPVCLYSKGFFLVKKNVLKFLRDNTNYEEILFVIVDKLYGNNLLIKEKVRTKEEAKIAYEKRGTDLLNLVQKGIREFTSSYPTSTKYVIKRWNEIADTEEYINLKQKVISVFEQNASLNSYCKEFIDDNLKKLTRRITPEKEELEHDYLFSEIAMSIYLPEFCGYNYEIWEKKPDKALPDPILILYQNEKESLNIILDGKDNKRQQMYINIE